MLPLVKPAGSVYRLRYQGVVGVAGANVQQSFDLSAFPASLRATALFKQSLFVLAQQIGTGVSDVASAVSFLPATGTPTTLVLTLTAAAPTDVIGIDVWYLHSLEGLAAGSQVYFIAKAGGGGPVDSIGSIIWRPGVPSSGSAVATWAEVEPHIAANSGNMVVQVDSSIAAAVIPDTADTECFARLELAGYTFKAGGGDEVTIADGGRLKNLHTVRSLTIRCVPTVRSAIQQNVVGTILICREGGGVTLDNPATLSAIELTAAFCECAAFEGSRYINNVAAGPAVMAIVGNLQFILGIIASAGTPPPPNNYSARTVSGGAGAVLINVFDASGTSVPQTLFAGTVVPIVMDWASAVGFQPVTPADWGAVVPAWVNAALDILAARSMTDLPFVVVGAPGPVDLNATSVPIVNGLTLTLPAAPAANARFAVLFGGAITVNLDPNGFFIKTPTTGLTFGAPITLSDPDADTRVVEYKFFAPAGAWIPTMYDGISVPLVVSDVTGPKTQSVSELEFLGADISVTVVGGTRKASITVGGMLTFGALVTVGGEYLIANGNWQSTGVAGGAGENYPVAKPMIVTRLAWAANGADATTQLDLRINGAVVETIPLTGNNGDVLLALPRHLTNGDLVSLAWSNGTIPNEIIASLA